MPIARAMAAKSGFCRSTPDFHLQGDESQNAIVEDYHLHRQFHLGQRDQVAHQHGKATIA
jgi:hypothetical protein